MAKNEDEAWTLARREGEDLEWSRVDDGHDWTIEDVIEEKDDEKL